VGSAGTNTWEIVKIDNGTMTALANSGVQSSSGTFAKLDVNMVNYGSACTVYLYINGALYATWTGNATLTGITGFDSVFVGCSTNNINSVSEIIVADESTLAFQGLVTLAPNGNGSSQQFSNPAYTNFSPININDANSTFTNTVNQDEQATISGLPSGNFQIKTVKVVARALATSGAAATNLKMGFNNTNTSTVAEGASHALGTAFAPVEEYFATDPTSSGGTGAWGSSLSGYQLELKSA